MSLCPWLIVSITAGPWPEEDRTHPRNINQESTSSILQNWIRHIDTSPTLYRPDCYIFHFKSFEISVVILLKVFNNVSCLISSQRINSGASAAAAGRCRADKLESGIIVWRGQAQAQSTSFYHNLKLKKVVHSFSGHLVVYISTWRPRFPRSALSAGSPIKGRLGRTFKCIKTPQILAVINSNSLCCAMCLSGA